MRAYPKLLLLSLLSLSLTTALNAQVSIRERVEINPSPAAAGTPGSSSVAATQPANGQAPRMTYYLPCGPIPEERNTYTYAFDEVWGNPVWSGQIFKLGTWALSPMPCWYDEWANWPIYIDVLEGSEYVTIHRTNPDYVEGYSFMFYPWGPNGEGWNHIYLFYPTDLRPVDSARVTYRVYSPTCGCTAIIHETIVTPHYSLYDYSPRHTAEYGSDLYLDIRSADQCGRTTPGMPEQTTYSVSITSGAEWGTLVNTQTGETGSTLTGLQHDQYGRLQYVAFKATGTEPEDVGSVVLRVLTSDPHDGVLDVGFTVITKTCYVLLADPPALAPGDTAKLTVTRQRVSDGRNIPFPPETRFSLMVGNGYAKVASSTHPDPAYYISNTLQGGWIMIADKTAPPEGTPYIAYAVPYQAYGLTLSASVQSAGSDTARMYMATLKEIAARRAAAGNTVQTASAGKTGQNTPVDPSSSVQAVNTVCSTEYAMVEVPSAQNTCVAVQLDASTLAPGDTTQVHVWQKRPDGSLLAFPSGQKFDAKIIEGWDFGEILTLDGQRGAEFNGITEPIRFVAGRAIDVKAKIQVIPGGTAPGGGCSPPTAEAEIKTSILLGESKYYHATLVENGSRLVIVEESKKGPPYTPTLANAWNANDAVTASGTLGVYWEKKGTGGNQVTPDTIRVIGRYWEEGKAFGALLTAHNGSQGSTAVIPVKKPVRLFDANCNEVDIGSHPYATTKGIRDNGIDIDALCISYAGQIGIPPQVIKGQMFTESYKANFQFYPTYRYEPWYDYNRASPKTNVSGWKDYLKQPFCVTGQQPNPMGMGKSIPLDHKNVGPMYYPTSAMSIADFTISHWDNYVDSQKGKIVGNKYLTRRFKVYLLAYTLVFSPYAGKVPSLIATEQIQREVKARYTGWAQTRKMASYGLIQMLYTTAQKMGYNKGKDVSSSAAPEDLNDETVEMPLYKAFTLDNLRDQLQKCSARPDANWPDGWEKTWGNSFYTYNSDPAYVPKVFRYAKKFSPQSR